MLTLYKEANTHLWTWPSYCKVISCAVFQTRGKFSPKERTGFFKYKYIISVLAYITGYCVRWLRVRIYCCEVNKEYSYDVFIHELFAELYDFRSNNFNTLLRHVTNTIFRPFTLNVYLDTPIVFFHLKTCEERLSPKCRKM